MRRVVTTISVVFLLAAPVFADQSLTIDLDPPKGAQSATKSNDIRLKHETLSRGSSSCASSKQSPTGRKGATICRVGVVATNSATIRNAPSSKGATLFTCPKSTAIAIVGQLPEWYGVLMVDGSTGYVPKSRVTLLNYEVDAGAAQQRTSGAGSQIVNAALKYLGIPYRWGGVTSRGIDCSGFVRSVFSSFGVQLPRVARDQAQVGALVQTNDLQPGDRLYFSCKGQYIDHTGIYMGNGLFIHSSIGRGGVAVDEISKPLFRRSLVTVRRS